MLNPTTEDQAFRHEWFRYMSIDDLRKSQADGALSFVVRILTDASRDKKVKSDPIAVMAVAVDSLGRITVFDYVREKMAPFDFLNCVFSLYDKYSAQFVVKQNAPLEGALQSFIDEKNKERISQGRNPVRFYDHSLGKNSKIARMEALQPYFQEGRIYFDPSLKHLSALEDEILKFPHNMTNDDGMDALSEICDPVVAKPPMFAKGEEEMKFEAPRIANFANAEIDWRRSQCKKLFDSRSRKKGRNERPGIVHGRRAFV
jgi:predicted phage terminase large subunit-like protein